MTDALDQEIEALLEEHGPLSTRELADLVGIDRKQAYRRCRRLAKGDTALRSRSRTSGRVLFFHPATGDVLTNTNYEKLPQQVAELKAIARKAGKKHGFGPNDTFPKKGEKGEEKGEEVRQAIRNDISAYLDGLPGLSPRQKEQVEAFKRQLMVVLKGTTVRTVEGMVDLRAFHPQERVWG